MIIAYIQDQCKNFDIKNFDKCQDKLFVYECMRRYKDNNEKECYEDLVYDLEYKIYKKYGFDISDDVLYNYIVEYIDKAFSIEEKDKIEESMINTFSPFNGDINKRLKYLTEGIKSFGK